MSLECAAAGGINLSQGVCDLEVPRELRDALKEAVEEDFHIYTRFDGLDSLRWGIAARLAKRGFEANPETEIVVTPGATGAFLSACMALLTPGDEVILFEPFYGYHRNTLSALGVGSRMVPMQAPDWSFSLEDVEAAVTKKTRGIMINTPANPTGKVFSREEIEGLGTIAQHHDLFLFTDEIYEDFLYDGREHLSPATFPGLRERTITISGFSKIFAITGWRIGYLVADSRWTQAMGYCADIATVCAPSLLQEAVARALERIPPSYYQSIQEDHVGKRTRILAALEDAGLPAISPQGAYYTLADISRLPGKTSQERVLHLLEASGVAAVPGEAFFENPRHGDHLARFCFAKKDVDLEQACRGLRRSG
jgi:aminotransferase